MNNSLNDFEKFAVSNGISTNKLDGYSKYLTKNGLINPTILEERQLNVVGIDIISRLMYDKIICLFDDVTSDSSNIIKSQLLYLNSISDKTDDIRLWIDTRGGDVIAGLSLIDVMNFVDPDVSTYCMGMCASMGAVILSSGTKGKRFSLKHGEIMIHQVRGGNEGVFSDMKINLEHSERLQNTLYKILSENTGKSFEEIERDAERDKWFTAEEAIQYCLIDNIITK